MVSVDGRSVCKGWHVTFLRAKPIPWVLALLQTETLSLQEPSTFRPASHRLRKISRHCKRRIMLTGTPLQNDLGELRGLLEFLLPDLFGEANEDDLGFGDEVR